MCLISRLKDTKNKKLSPKRSWLEGEKGGINQGLRLSVRLDKEAVIKLVDLWMCVNKINACYQFVVWEWKDAHSRHTEFQLWGSTGLLNNLSFPFAFFLKFVFLLYIVLASFISQLAPSFSCLQLSVYGCCSISFSRAVQWFLCISCKLSKQDVSIHSDKPCHSPTLTVLQVLTMCFY